MKFSVFQVSRQGSREKNEDRMGYSYTRESGLFLLADGMGGHPEGEVAAQLALQTISALYQKEAHPQVRQPQDFLSTALMAAHYQILRYASERAMLDTPRTTLVAALVQDGAAHWVHCGDSRLYLMRDGHLHTRTRDHSYQEQQAQGLLPSDAALNRNVLFTCLGSTTRPVFDLAGPLPLRQGDKLLLCSDGLWGVLEEADIVRELGRRPVTEAVPLLVDQALRQGGPHGDNVTAVAMEWETPDAFASTHGVATNPMGEEVFASTIQAELLDTLVDELDDAAIERSIAEINEAIRRTAARKP